MLKLETSYNLEQNMKAMDGTIEGSAMVNKLLKGFNIRTHYIESRDLLEGLESIVRFYIWNQEDLVKKLDLLFSEYKKINDFLMESQYYKSLPEEKQEKLVGDFNNLYFSIKFILTDIFNVYQNFRKKEEEIKKQKQITDKFLSELESL